MEFNFCLHTEKIFYYVIKIRCLVTHGLEFSIDLCEFFVTGTCFDGLCFCGSFFLSTFVPYISVGFTFGFETLDNIVVLPADFVAEATERSNLSAWSGSYLLEGSRDFEFLAEIVWSWATVDAFQVSVCSLTTASLIGQHTSDHTVDHGRWCAMMEWTIFWVGRSSVVHFFQHNQFISVEITGYEDAFTSDNGDIVGKNEPQNCDQPKRWSI